jgi:hypothetical protein
MFGTPQLVPSNNAVFNLVWTYTIKEVDNCKKARCTCNGFPRSGQVWVLNFTYVNCVGQTSARIFYAVMATENLIIFDANVLNAFVRPLLLSKGFISDRTRPSTIGGLTTKSARLYHPAQSVWSCWLCRDTLNPLNYGTNTLMQSSVTLIFVQ